MAAHACRIARNILEQPDDNIVYYASLALGAPGLDIVVTDGSVSCLGDPYCMLYDAVKNNDPEGVRAACKVFIAINHAIDHYGLRCMESVREAVVAIVKYGKPYFRARLLKFWDCEYDPEFVQSQIPAWAK